jgi:hypothetical protein
MLQVSGPRFEAGNFQMRRNANHKFSTFGSRSVNQWGPISDRQFLYLQVLLPVGVLLSSSVLPSQDTHCYMLHEQQQTISMPSSILKGTHFLLVNTSSWHLDILSAACVSSGLAKRGDLDSNAALEVGRTCYTRAELLLTAFLFRSTLCSKWAGICRYKIPELLCVPDFHTGTYIYVYIYIYIYIYIYCDMSSLR